MSGTTLCPHCDTRFKVAEAQLESHEGMVRCGSCLQAFDARPGYIPDQPSPQLELQMLNKPVEPSGELPADKPHAAETVETEAVDETRPVEETAPVEESASTEEAVPAEETGLIEAIVPADEAVAEETVPEIPHTDQLDFNPPAAAAVEPDEQPMTLAEQVAIVQDEDEGDRPSAPAYRR